MNAKIGKHSGRWKIACGDIEVYADSEETLAAQVAIVLTEFVKLRAERDRLRDAIPVLREAIGFFACGMQSGERWTPRCDEMKTNVLTALKDC